MGVIVNRSGVPYPPAQSAEQPLYEGATTGRLGTWGLNLAGPTASMYGALNSLRGRARDCYRNNPLAHGGVDAKTANEIGTDISPRWQLENEEQKKELQELWQDSVPELDYDETSDFYGLQEIVSRARAVDGEVLAHLIEMPSGSGLAVPFQVKVFESDHLDASFNELSDSGNEIRYGIEWKNGKRVAYHLSTEHPGENFLTADKSEKVVVPAADICHIFRPTRPGQARGASDLASVLVKLRAIDVYDDAEVIRKQVAAAWGGFIYSDTPIQGRNIGGTNLDTATNIHQIELKSGTFPVLKNGQKIAFNETADVGNNYRDFLKVQLQIIAKGFGCTYEQLSGDLEGVTFSSIRAGLIDFRRMIDALRSRTIIFQFCRPVINRWIKTAVLTRKLRTISIAEYQKNPRKFQRIEWMPTAWEYVDPVKDRIADVLDVRHGFNSRTAVVSKRGRDVERVDAENNADSKRAENLGLVYDSDPSQTNQSGNMQAVEDAAINDSVQDSGK